MASQLGAEHPELKQIEKSYKDPTMRSYHSQEVMIKIKNAENHEIDEKDVHLLSQEQLFNQFETSISGLTSEEAEKRLVRDGLNQITPVQEMGLFMKLILNLISGFQLMLWFGAILCFIMYGLNGDN